MDPSENEFDAPAIGLIRRGKSISLPHQCEDKVRRWLSTSQKEGLHQNLTMLVP